MYAKPVTYCIQSTLFFIFHYIILKCKKTCHHMDSYSGSASPRALAFNSIKNNGLDFFELKASTPEFASDVKITGALPNSLRGELIA